MSLPPVTQRQPRNFYTTNLTGREKARLLDGPILDKARQLADIPLLEPQFFHGAAAAPVIGAVDNAGNLDHAFHAAHRNSITFARRGDRHQAHRHLLKDVAVIQRGHTLPVRRQQQSSVSRKKFSLREELCFSFLPEMIRK